MENDFGLIFQLCGRINANGFCCDRGNAENEMLLGAVNMEKIILKNDYTTVVFQCKEEKIFIKSIAFSGKEYVYYEDGMQHSNVFCLGEYYPRGKMFNRYEFGGEALSFVGANEIRIGDKKELIIEEKNDRISVKTIYTLYDNSATLSVKKEIINATDATLSLECASPLTLTGIMWDKQSEAQENAQTLSNDIDVTTVLSPVGEPLKDGIRYMSQYTPPTFWKAHNTWCCEAVFEKFDLKAEGFRGQERVKRAGKISVSSNGSQTTNRYLPLGVFEKEQYGYLMFEILPVGSWSYEIEAGMSMGEDENEIIIALTGRNLCDNGWYKRLQPQEKYVTEEARIVGGADLDCILEQATLYRRNVKRKIKKEPYEEIVYNVFQSNVWANPSEEKDEKWIPLVAEIGADYYVIDAGWFDEGNTKGVGVWDENAYWYPSGLNATIEKIRAKNMKFGLWVELQSFGVKCEKPYLLPEYCFFHTDGIRTICNGRYQLNYALKEVRDYADGIIEKIVDKYHPDYIKIDYNQTQIGNDSENGSNTEGLAAHCAAYHQWFCKIQDKYPDIIFESCASGGMCIDSTNGALTTVFSVTDQGIYYNVPPIVANLPLAILPEQTGIWCVPVYDSDYPTTNDEKVIMNVINSLYGVMHLCSKIDVLTKRQKALLKEGMQYYRSLAKIKKDVIPVMPNGFTQFDSETVFTGMKTKDKLYLSIYNLSTEKRTVKKDLSKYGIENVFLAYPSQSNNEYSLKDGCFTLELNPMSARAFEFSLKR